MLDNLDEQEQAMMQMFAGTTDRIEKSFTIRIKPEALLHGTVLPILLLDLKFPVSQHL